MSWGAQNRSKDAKTPSVSRGRSKKTEPDCFPIQPYASSDQLARNLVQCTRLLAFPVKAQNFLSLRRQKPIRGLCGRRGCVCVSEIEAHFRSSQFVGPEVHEACLLRNWRAERPRCVIVHPRASLPNEGVFRVCFQRLSSECSFVSMARPGLLWRQQGLSTAGC
jgi:hypothetical protein